MVICDMRYEQPSGYRPAPLDLSQMALCSALETAVDSLAENEHNAWAKELIRQGWTYGAQQVHAAHHQTTRHFTWDRENVNVIYSM